MSDDSSPHDQRETLLRQREALRAQLAQVEQAMAREAAREDERTPSADEDPDALLRRYAAEEPRLDPQAARRGCLLAFAGALALLAGGVATVYFVFYARR